MTINDDAALWADMEREAREKRGEPPVPTVCDQIEGLTRETEGLTRENNRLSLIASMLVIERDQAVAWGLDLLAEIGALSTVEREQLRRINEGLDNV
jgi:hypothetical protein